MDPKRSEDKAHFKLRPGVVHARGGVSGVDPYTVGQDILRLHISWFIRLRWGVVGALLLLLLLSVVDVTTRIGLNLSPGWMAVLATVLAACNVGYFLHHRYGRNDGWTTHANLWTQICVDLAAVTVVVHYAGSSTSFAPFLYAIHIVLACIFFAPRLSLLVVLLSTLLYSGCVLLEVFGWLPVNQVFLGLPPDHLPTNVRILQMVSAILLWSSVWALGARLSMLLHQREAELLQANERVRRTLKISQDHMHHTSHQMKAPLDAIRSNISLLEGGFAGELSPKAGELIKRIEARSNALSEFIQDMLRLATLKAGENIARAQESVALDTLIRDCLHTVQDQAQQRKIRLDAELAAVAFPGNPDALRMLFDNLLTNAVNYSHDGGAVRISCSPGTERWAAVVEIQDQGIGIPADALNRIFDDYFRTTEAKKHNPQSTGVGMAIVKQVATQHNLTIEVESEVNQGTRFTIRFPATAGSTGRPQP